MPSAGPIRSAPLQSPEIEACLLRGLEDSGQAGLCAEGRIEAAVGAAAQRWPALDRASLARLARRLLDEQAF